MSAIPQNDERGNFGSMLGFIMAGAGSAIGLGNIWRFPYTAGESGGGAFIAIYLFFVLLIGVPVLFAELMMGRASQKNPVGAFKALAPGSMFWLVGALGVVTGFGILAFYSVVAGWTLGYMAMAISGDFAGQLDADASTAIFTSYIGDGAISVAGAGGFLALTALVVRGGVQKGIERTTTVLMPMFFLLLVILAARAVTLPGAGAGIEFIFSPDFSKVTPTVVVKALGQALFSLSLGMGAMMTYGSYLDRKNNLPLAGASVAFFDTAIALLAGLIIFPAVFATGADPAGGAGLVFVVLPTIFQAMPAGQAFAIAFYGLLAIAALTSTISLLEVVVAYLVDELGVDRELAVWGTTAACFVLAVPSALGNGAVGFFSKLPGLGIGFLDFQNNLWGNYSLSLGALAIAVFVGWVWGTDKALQEVSQSGDAMPVAPVWAGLLKFLCPVAIAAVLVYVAVTGDYF